MNILDDLKLQYRLGGIAMRLIYWNVACFIISLVFFLAEFYRSICLSELACAVFRFSDFFIQALDVFNVCFFSFRFLASIIQYDGFEFCK